jgi:hypothetical protein
MTIFSEPVHLLPKNYAASWPIFFSIANPIDFLSYQFKWKVVNGMAPTISTPPSCPWAPAPMLHYESAATSLYLCRQSVPSWVVSRKCPHLLQYVNLCILHSWYKSIYCIVDIISRCKSEQFFCSMLMFRAYISLCSLQIYYPATRGC